MLVLICNESPLLLSVIDCIKAKDLSLATVAANFLNELAKIPTGVQVLFQPILLNAFKRLTKEGDVVKFRVYDVSPVVLFIYRNISYNRLNHDFFVRLSSTYR